METNIYIQYQNLPDEIINEFKSEIAKSNFSFSSDKNTQIEYYASGGPADLILYIDQHLFELIASQLIARGAYDIIKHSIVTMWQKIVLHYKNKNKPIQDDKNFISLNFNVKPDKTIEYFLEGEVSEKMISEITEKLFESVRNNVKNESVLMNPDFINPNKSNQTIGVQFNSTTSEWKIIDYAALKKQFDKWVEENENKFNS